MRHDRSIAILLVREKSFWFWRRKEHVLHLERDRDPALHGKQGLTVRINGIKADLRQSQGLAVAFLNGRELLLDIKYEKVLNMVGLYLASKITDALYKMEVAER